MNEKVSRIVCTLLIVVGVVFGYFADFATGQLVGFAVTMFGVGVAISKMWKERNPEKPDWLSIVTMAVIGVGALISGFTNVLTEDSLSSLISNVIAILMIVFGTLVDYKYISKK